MVPGNPLSEALESLSYGKKITQLARTIWPARVRNAVLLSCLVAAVVSVMYGPEGHQGRGGASVVAYLVVGGYGVWLGASWGLLVVGIKKGLDVTGMLGTVPTWQALTRNLMVTVLCAAGFYVAWWVVLLVPYGLVEMGVLSLPLVGWLVETGLRYTPPGAVQAYLAVTAWGCVTCCLLASLAACRRWKPLP